ncbi:hypothetical protein ALC56_09298 [Trachymyrmex septentrionalis]|uniref:Uncharacterized protein n=1 Tax=Trachymyrmex septentrionalis TaxID=34720 RepID=A0A195F7C0_9HYME|nr:hypothetical protein ALC56_09298 [Trachymyrmex septentrionalis]
MSLVSFHITMRRMFTRRIVRFLYGSQKRIMGWHSVRKWKRPIPSILRARPRANDEEYGAHDAPKRKTGDMDQDIVRMRSRPLHSASHMPLFPRGRPTKHFHVQRICARLILFPSGPVNIGCSSLYPITPEVAGTMKHACDLQSGAHKEKTQEGKNRAGEKMLLAVHGFPPTL